VVFIDGNHSFIMKTTARFTLFFLAGFGLLTATAFLADTIGPAADFGALLLSIATVAALAGVALIDLVRTDVSSEIAPPRRLRIEVGDERPRRAYVKLPALVEFADARRDSRAA
jgi:hypothetical protein